MRDQNWRLLLKYRNKVIEYLKVERWSYQTSSGFPFRAITNIKTEFNKIKINVLDWFLAFQLFQGAGNPLTFHFFFLYAINKYVKLLWGNKVLLLIILAL